MSSTGYFLACRTVADILLSGQAVAKDAEIDFCQICGASVAITPSGQKRRRENQAWIVVCNTCAVAVVEKQKADKKQVDVEIGSPECEEGLRRSAHAREQLAKLKKGI